MDVVKNFLDVLQNIETGVIEVFKLHPSIGDKDAIAAIEKLIGAYTREKKKLPVLPHLLSGTQLVLFDAMKSACESRLTRTAPDPVEDEEMGYLIPVRLMIICLERIRDSMVLWHKNEGHRGYLNHVAGFLK